MSFFVPLNLVPLAKNMYLSFGTFYGTFWYLYDNSVPFIHSLMELRISMTEKVHKNTFSVPFWVYLTLFSTFMEYFWYLFCYVPFSGPFRYLQLLQCSLQISQSNLCILSPSLLRPSYINQDKPSIRNYKATV